MGFERDLFDLDKLSTRLHDEMRWFWRGGKGKGVKAGQKTKKHGQRR